MLSLRLLSGLATRARPPERPGLALGTGAPLALLGPCFKTGHGGPTLRQLPRRGRRDLRPRDTPRTRNRRGDAPRDASSQRKVRARRGEPRPGPAASRRRHRTCHHAERCPAALQSDGHVDAAVGLYDRLSPRGRDGTSPSDARRRASHKLTVTESPGRVHGPRWGPLNSRGTDRLGTPDFPPNGFTLS